MSHADPRLSTARPASSQSSPEKRLVLRRRGEVRHLRLRPGVLFAALAGGVLVLGWAIAATAILAVDMAGGHVGNGQHARAAFEQRLTQLVAERDARAIEAVTAQEQFAAALDQVSQMQSRLLASEQRRQELEAGLTVAQAALNEALTDRDMAQDEAARLAASLKSAGDTPEVARSAEYALALDLLSDELEATTASLDAAQAQADEARDEARRLAVERDSIVAHNDAILAQLEDAMTLSTEPLDKMFRSVGVNPDDLLSTVRQGYSGTGGPLETQSVSSHGDSAITAAEARATKVLITLNEVNSYRIAMNKVPLAMPLRSAFRYSSGFGPRWGRMHSGIDMALPIGSPVYSTAEGVVIFAGWQRGYGNVIKIQHELGIETRYGHLSKIGVSQGQKVSRGTRIGDSGNTGRSTGPHLHYEVRVNGTAVDPMKFIKAAQNVF